MVKLALCTSLVIGLSFTLPSNPCDLTGHLRSRSGKTEKKLGQITVFVKEQEQILASTLTDSKGDFHLHFSPKAGQSSSFYAVENNRDTVLLASYKTFESDTPEITF